MKPWMIALSTVAALSLAGLTGYALGRRPVPAAPSVAASQQVLYWYDPMVPAQHFDRPGLSPMGMQMVPKYAQPADDADSVRIDAATLQNLGVRVAPVQRRVLETELEIPGTVTWDTRQASIVSTRVDGVVTHLHVRAPYTAVAAGAPLLDLLAPAWNSAMAETDALRHAQSPEAQALRTAAQQRLRVLGLTAADLQAARAADGSLTLHAPQAGMVTTLDVREGQRVTAGQTLMTLNSQASVWVDAAVPQALAGRIRAGTPVSVRSDASPGAAIGATVESLLPDLDPTTRTQRARIVLANTDGQLSPGQFVRVAFTPGASAPVLAIPTEALIVSGERPRVIVALGDGRFRPVLVRTGHAAGGYTEITAGLHSEEQVVVSGQFLLDSEASLSGALERLQADSAPSMDGAR